MTTAILGQGRMGSAMAVRLLGTGAEVVVWNRDTAACGPARAAGAVVAGTVAEAVAAAEVVLVMLADDPAVAAVLAEAAPAVPRETVVVQSSTIDPCATRRLATTHPGVRLVDAPVKGSVPQVRAGRLEVLAAGDAADVDRARPVLEALGSIVDCGRIGGGSAAKLVVNAAMITATAALAEAVGLAARLGVDEGAARALLTASPLAAALDRYDPGGGDFPLYLAAKDIRLADETATGAGDAGSRVFAAVERRLTAAAVREPEAGMWTVVRRAFDAFEH